MLVSVCGLALRDADLLSPVFAQALRKQVCVHLFGAEVNANRDDWRRPADVFVRTDMSFADFFMTTASSVEARCILAIVSNKTLRATKTTRALDASPK
jgi:hypothetical protein